MPIYDHKCEEGHYTEDVKGWDEKTTKCRKCGKPAHRVIAMTGVNCINEDAPWIRDVLEVVDKESDRPWVKEFVKNPTRSNWKRWMSKEGIRIVEDGEDNYKMRREQEAAEHERKTKEVYRKYRERRKIIVSG